MMKKILEEFAEQMRYNYHDVATEAAGQISRITIEPKKGRRLRSSVPKISEVVYLREPTSDSNLFRTTVDRLLVSLSEIPTTTRRRYTESRIAWIDVALSERTANRSFITEELASHFTRYGIHLVTCERMDCAH
jgi:hypothetical protein